MCQIMRGIVANPMMLPMLEENSLFPFNPSLDDEIQRLFDVPVRKQLPTVDEVMEEFRLNGRDFEYCPDVDTDTSKQTASRRKKNKKPLPTECVFCRNNGEEESFYREHLLKDVDGRILCPVLRAYTCPICGVSGDLAHTVKYCPRGPYNPNTISTANAFKSMRNSTGKRRSKKDCSRGKQSIERIRFLLTEGVPTSASANETTIFVCENERM